MNEKNDFIKVSRSLLEWEWYQDSKTLQMWLHCLLQANWKDGKFKGNVIKRGSFATSINKLCLQLGMSEQNVKTALKHLKSSGNITSKGYSKYSIITVVGYNEMQRSNKQNNLQTNQQVTNSQPTSNQQVTTIEEKKEEKEKKEVKNNTNKAQELSLIQIINSFTKNKELRTSLKEFCKMRKAIKKPIITERAMRDRLNELSQLSSDNEELISIVNQSVDNCWQRFYGLKKNSTRRKEVIDDTNISDEEYQKMLMEINKMRGE